MQVFCNYTHGITLETAEGQIALRYGANTVNGRVFNAWLGRHPSSPHLAENNLYVLFEKKAPAPGEPE